MCSSGLATLGRGPRIFATLFRPMFVCFFFLSFESAATLTVTLTHSSSCWCYVCFSSFTVKILFLIFFFRQRFTASCNDENVVCVTDLVTPGTQPVASRHHQHYTFQLGRSHVLPKNISFAPKSSLTLSKYSYFCSRKTVFLEV